MMNDDLIKRSDAIAEIYKVRTPDVASHHYAELFINAVCRAPSADRPQGKWFKDDEGTFICSACGTGDKDQPTLMGKPMFEWCPFCGCRMKGADDE